MSEFNQIIRMLSKSQALVEPGITIEQLNSLTKKDGYELPLLAKDQTTVEEAIQKNAICFESLKHGFFADTNSVVRVGLIKGNGEPIQTGGNKVSDDVSFGLPMTKLLVGSHYNLGLIYEALVNLTPVTPSDGHHITIQITPGDVVAILEGYKDYLDDSEKVLADGLVMSFNQGQGLLQGYSFGDQSEVALQGAIKSCKLNADLNTASKDLLHKSFSESIGSGLDTLEVLIPIEGLIKILPEFVEDGNLFSKHTLTAHLLKDKTIYLQIGFNPSQESELVLLDKLTSSIIKRGGTLRTSNRASLDAISPFLAKRIVGQGSLSLQ